MEKKPKACLTATPGTYVLLLRLRAGRVIQVGKRGRVRFAAGWYVYVGSAFGPGGLGARLARHLRAGKKKRWHIDYLRSHAVVRRIWVDTSGERLEHRWAVEMLTLSDAATAIPRFGCSDCRCATHLFHFKTRPDAALFRERLAARPLAI